MPPTERTVEQLQLQDCPRSSTLGDPKNSPPALDGPKLAHFGCSSLGTPASSLLCAGDARIAYEKRLGLMIHLPSEKEQRIKH
mmetsp:Transcript_10411/g.13825  ORF Transcript_10411/g.13825 Transcript_10411/m.13825 type:complete len:83 (-) Transcript_10411:288-536(-)